MTDIHTDLLSDGVEIWIDVHENVRVMVAAGGLSWKNDTVGPYEIDHAHINVETVPLDRHKFPVWGMRIRESLGDLRTMVDQVPRERPDTISAHVPRHCANCGSTELTLKQYRNERDYGFRVLCVECPHGQELVEIRPGTFMVPDPFEWSAWKWEQ